MKYTPPVGQETGGESAHYINGNPELGILGSPVPAEAVEHPQREIVEVIKKAGLDPDGDDLTQLWQAIGQIISTKAPIATKKKPGLVQIGNGLAITPEGLLSVLIASTSQAGLVKPRYGLKIGADGSLDVDFGDMPTDKFEELLKSIRVPIWLTGNKDFYVNGVTGSNTLDAGRGESAEKPFKTIQACVNYVCENYNMSSFRARINIADGIYPELIRLPSYSSGTGYVEIAGNNDNKEAVVVRGIFTQFASLFALTSLTAKETSAFKAYSAIVQATAGTLNFQNFEIDCTGVPEDSATFSGLWVRNSGVVYVVGANSMTPPTGLTVKMDASRKVVSAVAASSGGTVTFNADFFLEGDSPQGFTPISMQSLSACSFVDSSANYPGRAPQVTATGTISGPRYRVAGNSVLDTRGGGPEFFPGSQNGVVGTGGQYL